jgi:hypothetical protein
MRGEDVERKWGAIPIGQSSKNRILVHFIRARYQKIDDALDKCNLHD